MIKIIICVCFFAVTLAATFCMPEFLAHNAFLVGFINHEVLAVLTILLTITLASVANIHMMLNRIIEKVFKDKKKGAAAAAAVRSEIDDNAKMLFVMFLVAILLLILKGVTTEVHVTSFVHGAVLSILLASLLALYDIYQVIFGLVKSEELGRDTSTSGPEFSPDHADIAK